MQLKYFGTDGFRGKVNEVLRVEHALKIGQYLGYYHKKTTGKNAVCVIGKDTRVSSYMLEYALSAGITSAGSDAYLMHVTTSPSVSYITKVDHFDYGIMITASHNPYHDNGIKIFDSQGNKLTDEFLYAVEQFIDDKISFEPSKTVGVCKDYISGRNKYIGYLASIPQHSFRGYRIGLDCANGASSSIAKNVFDMLGADLVVIHNTPNGENINVDCGSTHIEKLQQLVKEQKLDIGFAFDGDADRCIMVDETGAVVDGDGILYLLASYLKSKNSLSNSAIAITVMSNLGLINALKEQGIDSVITDVGDKYISMALDEKDLSLGGEQSGHIIIKRYANTGDGILTALMVMDVLVRQKTLASYLASAVKVIPQKLVNVTVDDKDAVMNHEKTPEYIKKVNESLNGSGRLLLRKSGTEPFIRIMVESNDEDECNRIIEETKEFITSLK